MSWDVVIFAPVVGVTTNKVRDAFHKITVGQHVYWSASYDFQLLIKQLNKEFPLHKHNEDCSPWLAGTDQGEGYLFLKVVHSRVNEVKSVLEEMPGIEHLIIFDVGKDKITQGGKPVSHEEKQPVMSTWCFWKRWFSKSV